MKIKNFYTANTAEPGDVFLVTVKAIIMYDGTYRLYRCPVESDGVPEGDPLNLGEYYLPRDADDSDDELLGIEITAQQLFPILRITKGPDFG